MSEPTAPRLLVLDTSVAAKWYLPEELREEALALSTRVGTGEVQLLAPSIIGPELFNALYQPHRRAYLSLDEVRAFFSSFREAPVSLFEIDPLTSRAAEITLDSGVVVYDALFLALAEEAGTVVVTADSKLLQALRGTSYAHRALPRRRRQPRPRDQVRTAGVRQSYCNRDGTGRYGADTANA